MKLTAPPVIWMLLALVAATLSCLRIAAQWPAAQADHLSHVILFHGTLPRIAVAMLAGAALGLAGLLLQRVLRNALAEPSTLGISAGAHLAMAAATIYLPALMEWSTGFVAFAGGITAMSIVLALTWRRGLEPVSVVLAGMMVALTATSASAALILANGDYLFSLFIWGGGSLVQQSWDPAVSIAISLAVGMAATLLLLRPLAILGLDDTSAKSLGMAPHASRFIVVLLAAWIATTVTAQVGVIGFIGLAAPALASLSGARSLRQRFLAAPVIGAILLWLTDGLVQLAAGPAGERLPTGAATALLGGPLLLWLLPRLRMMEWPSLTGIRPPGRRAARPATLIVAIFAACVLAVVASLLVGMGPDGWSIAYGDALYDLADWRWPRIVAVFCAGAMLAAAGVLVQRLTGNPLASPEVLGVGTGAGAGLTAVIMFDVAAGMAWQLGGAAAGALASLVFILAIATRGRFGPERLLLGGVAVGAACSAIITAVIAMGNAQSYVLLRWLTGSTGAATPSQALLAAGAMTALLLPAMLTARWLDILPLGSAAARGLGVPVRAAQLAIMVLAALLSALAAMIVGPLSFIGLIAPHLARLAGFGRAIHHLVGSVLLGALLMVVSDWLARMAAFPYQLPVGLFASLIGGPYLVFLLAKGARRHG